MVEGAHELNAYLSDIGKGSQNLRSIRQGNPEIFDSASAIHNCVFFFSFYTSYLFVHATCSLCVCILSVCVFSLCVFSLYGDQLTFDQHCWSPTLLVTNTVGHQHCWSPTHCWSLLTNTVGHFPPEGLRHPRGICSRVFSFILCFLY